MTEQHEPSWSGDQTHLLALQSLDTAELQTVDGGVGTIGWAGNVRAILFVLDGTSNTLLM